MSQLLATKRFQAEIIREHSSFLNVEELGVCENEMRLYQDEERHCLIEWEVSIPEGEDEVEHIGLWFDKKNNLIDYDGIMGFLPVQAADLIEELGFKVDRKEFCG